MSDPVDGLVDAALAAELPGLRLRQLEAPGRPGRTPSGLRRRLDDAAGRLRGADAVLLATRPVPHAYRVLFRQLGLDPDRDRPPAEAAVVARLLAGGLGTGDHIADALTLAVVETGVGVLALDHATLTGALALRPAVAGETIADGGHAHDVPAGRLVIADDEAVAAVLFGRCSSRHAPGRATVRLRLVAVVAPGVPDAHVDEALWLAGTALGGRVIGRRAASMLRPMAPVAPSSFPAPPATEVDERAARRTLRAQIARLERELAHGVAAGFPHLPGACATAPAADVGTGPRLRTLGELEEIRDDLAQRVRRAGILVAQRAAHEAAARARLAELVRDPRRHKWARVRAADLGERGCGAYQARPRLGLIGMLMGWWQVKLSSGCP